MHSADQLLNENDLTEIRGLEESLWRANTRFDNELMDRTFAADFFEFGRSGRTYSRVEMMFEPGMFDEIQATLPLSHFNARYLSYDIVQVTYVSEVIYDSEKEQANRSSIWARVDEGWQLRFHQGTPV